MFTTGIGLGMAYAESSQMVKDYHEGIRRRALLEDQRRNPFQPHQQTPPGGLS